VPVYDDNGHQLCSVPSNQNNIYLMHNVIRFCLMMCIEKCISTSTNKICIRYNQLVMEFMVIR